MCRRSVFRTRRSASHLSHFGPKAIYHCCVQTRGRTRTEGAVSQIPETYHHCGPLELLGNKWLWVKFPTSASLCLHMLPVSLLVFFKKKTKHSGLAGYSRSPRGVRVCIYHLISVLWWPDLTGFSRENQRCIFPGFTDTTEQKVATSFLSTAKIWDMERCSYPTL